MILILPSPTLNAGILQEVLQSWLNPQSVCHLSPVRSGNTAPNKFLCFVRKCLMINAWGIPLNTHKVCWNNMRLFFCENQRAEKRAHWCLSHPRFSMLSMQSWSGSPRCQAEACAFYLLGPWIQATNHQLSVKMMGVNSQTNSCPTDMERKIIG